MTATEGFIAVEADRAHADAPTFIALEHWTEAKTPMFDGSDQHPARVWRRGKAVVVEGGPAPFKTQGVVVGVSPQVLAVMLTDIAMKDHERHKAPHERNTEREMVQQVDPQTKASSYLTPHSVLSISLHASNFFTVAAGMVGSGQFSVALGRSRDAVRRALGGHGRRQQGHHCTDLHRNV